MERSGSVMVSAVWFRGVEPLVLAAGIEPDCSTAFFLCITLASSLCLSIWASFFLSSYSFFLLASNCCFQFLGSLSMGSTFLLAPPSPRMSVLAKAILTSSSTS